MTARARLVLEDARAAAGPYDEATIRRRLVATMALLRAVGHVLKEVDSKSSQALNQAINEKWQEPRPAVRFWEQYLNDVDGRASSYGR